MWLAKKRTKIGTQKRGVVVVEAREPLPKDAIRGPNIHLWFDFVPGDGPNIDDKVEKTVIPTESIDSGQQSERETARNALKMKKSTKKSSKKRTKKAPE
jgi:hypothetical protein